MSPEAAAHLAKAEEFLAKTADMRRDGWFDEVGRAAYFAAFHAARAMLFERQRRTVKTHSGVRVEFHRLAEAELAIDDELKQFLGRGFNMKAAADYETGEQRRRVDPAQADDAVTTARRFVSTIARLLDAGAGPDERA